MKKAFDKLSDRERQVLAALIDHYVKSAQPVGSRVLANRYKLGVSPATIRNTLQDLEELGLVTQPHTSAGRIPTDLGYRIYVDLLLKPEQLSLGERQKIDEEITSAFTPIDQILEQTSRILAEVSSQLGVSTSPEFDRAVLTKMEMLPVAERKLLVVIAVRSGLVKTILMEVDSEISSSMVAETSRLLNEKLVGLTLGDIKRTISDRFKDVRLGDPRLLRVFTESVNALSTEVEGDSLHVGGTPNILRQPEFRDREILDQLLGVLESHGIVSVPERRRSRDYRQRGQRGQFRDVQHGYIDLQRWPIQRDYRCDRTNPDEIFKTRFYCRLHGKASFEAVVRIGEMHGKQRSKRSERTRIERIRLGQQRRSRS
jgi:heat-inducible transcriptional repressor